jgi:alkaline phosphatase
MRKLLFGAVGAFVLTLGSAHAAELKYVFLMIGDGMGLPQRNAAEIFLSAVERKEIKPGIVKMTTSSLPVQGMQTTYALNSLITDSAAAGTALATGHKTNNGVIAMDAAGKTKFKTIAEAAHEQGWKIGIVTSVSLDHATPASFYAHAAGRTSYYDIATQIMTSGFEYFGGGAVLEPTGKNKDRPSFYDEAVKTGYTVVKDRAGFDALKPGAKIYAENPVRQDENAFPYAVDANLDGNKGAITLAEFTKKGIDLLAGGKFFMMVEGGKIDWACHANDAVASIGDTIAFDEAVKVAYDFYAQHPDETLIVSTADHETGGLTIGFAATKYESAIPVLGAQKMSYIAFGDRLTAFKKDNPEGKFEDVLPLLKQAYGIEIDQIAPYEVEALRKAFAETMIPKEKRNAKDTEKYMLYGGYEPLAMAANHIVSGKAGLGWTTYSHTGIPVPVAAVGTGATEFAGYYDNTDLSKRLFKLMGL